jgi:hypothetical protein
MSSNVILCRPADVKSGSDDIPYSEDARTTIFTIHTKNIYKSIRITDTPSSGAVVTPDWFDVTALGSSLHPTTGLFN